MAGAGQAQIPEKSESRDGRASWPTRERPTRLRYTAAPVALTTALRISTLLPREQEAIFSILRILNGADEQLRRQEVQPRSEPFDEGLLNTIIATYRRALADLAR